MSKGPYNGAPKYVQDQLASRIPSKSNSVFSRYINDFSKALAGEVRILLAEVGQLRDERRALQ
jgi:hypothetical protein